MRTEWVVLADAQKARIFARVGGAGWQDIRSLNGNAVKRDDNGREVRLPAAMERLNTAISMPVIHDDDFINRLALELRVARKRGDFDRLILVAGEDVLQSLQLALDAATRRTLSATVAENLLVLPMREARRQLMKRF